jgi:hypothetical protein
MQVIGLHGGSFDVLECDFSHSIVSMFSMRRKIILLVFLTIFRFFRADSEFPLALANFQTKY